MNLLLAGETPFLKVLSIIGFVLVMLFLVTVVVYFLKWFMGSLSGAAKQSEPDQQAVVANNSTEDDLSIARASVGYDLEDEKRIEQEREIEAAKEREIKIKEELERERKQREGKDTNEKLDKSNKENTKNFFEELNDGDEKAFDFSNDVSLQPKPVENAFNSEGFFGDENKDTGFDAFKFQEEPKEAEMSANTVINQPLSQPVVVGLTRDEVSEMLQSKEEERKSELAKMEDELKSLKEQLKAEKDKKSENYAQLLAEEQTKEEEMSRIADEIAALRRELEKERQALIQEREAIKREAEAAAKGEQKQPVQQTAAANPLNDEIAALRRDLEKQKEERAREKAELAEKARQDEIAALKRDLEKQKEERVREREEASEQIKKIKEQYALYQNEIDRQNKDVQDRITRDRKEKTDAEVAAVNDLFARMQAEIDALKKQNAGTVKKADNAEVSKKQPETAKEQTGTGELALLMAELIEERKNSRAEAQMLRSELEAERADSQKRLQEQFELIKVELDSRKKAEDEIVYNEKINALKREQEANERALHEKYELLRREAEAQTTNAIQQSEVAEKHLKAQMDAMKVNMAQEARALADKNEELLRELEAVKAENEKAKAGADKILEAERARLQEQVKGEYEENERMLNEKYMQLRTELQRESKQLADKRDEVEQEMEELRKAQERLQKSKVDLNVQNLDAMEELKREKARLQEELKKREKELASAKAVTTKVRTENNALPTDTDKVQAELTAQLQQEYEEKEKALHEKYEALQSELKREEEAIKTRQSELLTKEKQIAEEAARIREESSQVSTLITEKVYTKEEHNRILADYRSKIDVLRERLRTNEKAIRDNNKEYVPLRRIKDTMERDLKLLRKREATVAKQQVLVYGVNNITELNPERIKKLEQDVQQLSGLQQSVANCQEILNKNKDRYPTLENLSKVLSQQNKQLISDIEEIEHAVSFFESSAVVE